VISLGSKEAPRPPYAGARQERAIQEAPLTAGLLSAREREVLAARTRGRSVKEIAHELGIAEGTVRTLLSRCFAKLRR
jgi:RNA polymerase sigma factor (sigma-70 family)